MYSNKDSSDTAYSDILFKVIIVAYPCTQQFVDPIIATPFKYYIKTPSVPMKISFSGLSNNNCFFSTILSLSNGSAIDSSVFTYTNEVLIVDSSINTLYSAASVPSLIVNTNNIAKQATISFTLTIFSHASSTDKL